MTRVIELNDSGLRLAGAEGVLAESPGYAVVDARRLLVGAEAARQARLDPRHTTNQFWHRLSTDPVPHPHPSARSLADLAHAHLLELWEAAADDGDDAVIFALPGTLERDQIALLLGIARECPFRPVGLVDAALAATAGHAPADAPVVHVDALLHEAVVTVIEGDGADWQRGAVRELPQLGLAPLREAWINVVADTFVRETRFDPLHDARTEQSLFDRLDGWLAALAARPEIELEIESTAQVHRVAMRRDRLVEKVAPRLALLADALAEALPGGGRMLLSHRLGHLPGILDLLAERLGRAPETIAPEATIEGALAHEGDIRHDGEALRFVTRLPRRSVTVPAEAPDGAAAASSAGPARPASGTPAADPPPGPSPATAGTSGTEDGSVTHVLLGHRAWPLAGTRIDLGGPGGLDPGRFPSRLGTLERRSDGWHLTPAQGTAELPPMAPGEARVLGPAHTLVTLIRVEVP